VPLDDGLLVAHAVATCWLAGLVWTVQLVVYPAFARVGPGPGWASAHQQHSDRMVLAVGPPWAVQGLALLLLLLRRPDGVPLLLLAAAGVLAAVPVAVTVLVSVPMHVRLGRGWDDDAWRRLLRTNWLRTAELDGRLRRRRRAPARRVLNEPRLRPWRSPRVERMGRPEYPPAERLDLVERLHGRDVADPYRWLEDADDPRTVDWSAAQDALCRQHLDDLPGRSALADRLTACCGRLGRHARVAGRPAVLDPPRPDQEHAVLRRGTPTAPSACCVDPVALDPSGATRSTRGRRRRRGQRLAYQVSSGGDEESLLHVVDVATGALLDGPVDRCRYSPSAWVPGGEELFYVRRLPPSQVPAGEEQFHRRVYRHRVGTSTDDDVEVWGDGLDATNYYGCAVSLDGRWLVVTASAGTAPRDDVWLFDLTAPDAPPAEVQVGADARCAAWVGRDGRLWLLTDRDAPRGRLCTADPTSPGAWTTVVDEDTEAVLEDVELLDGDDGPVLAVLRTRHAVSELSLHDLDGALLRPVPLPGVGSVGGLSAPATAGRTRGSPTPTR
jgi:hypothetical protein